MVPKNVFTDIFAFFMQVRSTGTCKFQQDPFRCTGIYTCVFLLFFRAWKCPHGTEISVMVHASAEKVKFTSRAAARLTWVLQVNLHATCSKESRKNQPCNSREIMCKKHAQLINNFGHRRKKNVSHAQLNWKKKQSILHKLNGVQFCLLHLNNCKNDSGKDAWGCDR